MKVLLLNPPKYKRDRVLPYVSREECGIGTVSKDFLPSQICLATSYLREKGIDADLLDMKNGDRLSIGGYDVVVVWVSVIESFYEDLDFLRKAKEEGKKTVIVLNEPYEGFEMEVMQNYTFIDASIRLWERELALEKLLSAWKRGENPKFPGVIYRHKNNLFDNGKMPYLPDLKHLSSSSKVIEELPLEKYEAAAITPGRGCPIGCTFCLYRQTAIRKRRIEDVIAEFETVSTSIRNVLLLDPALPPYREWMNRFCDELIKRKLKVSWRTDLRAEHCSLEVLEKIKRAGCKKVLMGVETLDEDIGRKIMAGVPLTVLKKSVRNLRRTRVDPIPIFYLGYPWDSDYTIIKIKNFLIEAAFLTFDLTYVRPWKGTPLYFECKKLGLLKNELRIKDFVYPYSPYFDTLYLTKKELESLRSEIFRSTIFNPRYLLRTVLETKNLETKHFELLFRTFKKKVNRIKSI